MKILPSSKPFKEVEIDELHDEPMDRVADELESLTARLKQMANGYDVTVVDRDYQGRILTARIVPRGSLQKGRDQVTVSYNKNNLI
jgi:hypothetical protein